MILDQGKKSKRNYIRNNKEKAVDPLRVGGLFGLRVRSGYGLSWAPDTPRVPVARGERDGLCDWPTRLALHFFTFRRNFAKVLKLAPLR